MISFRIGFISVIIFIISSTNTIFPDTFSICAVDPVTGQVGSAGASCVTDCTILTDVHPGWGVVHTQAYWLSSNQQYARSLMLLHINPSAIIDSLVLHDAQNNPTIRQYLIVDRGTGTGVRCAGYTGVNCDPYKNHIIGPNYVIAGNILLGQQILDSMQARFLRENGTLADKLMAALQGAKVIGADTRCAPRGTSSRSAFIRVARTQDTLGILWLNLKVLNAPVNRDPIDSLQVLYNSWLTTGVKSVSSEIPVSITLYQNYPNPFNPVTTIRFDIPPDEKGDITNVKLKIYDVSGKIVNIIVNEYLRAGSYEVNWNAGNYASGIYYYTLTAWDNVTAKAMVLIK